MAKNDMNLQDSFLNQVRKDNAEIQLVLLDGTRLTGLVRGFDNFTVIVNARGQQHLIYKHAISQIISRRPHHHAEGEHQPAAEAAATETPEGEPAAEGEPAPPPPRPNREAGNWRPREQRQGGNRPEGQHRDFPPRDNRGGGERRGGDQRGERRSGDQRPNQGGDRHSGPKFNTIDLSNIKVDANEPAAQAPPAAQPAPPETPQS
jgi:host factor-I protein